MVVASELQKQLKAGEYSKVIAAVEALNVPNEELKADVWLLYYISKYKNKELPKEAWKVGKYNNPESLDRKKYINELAFWYLAIGKPEKTIKLIKTIPQKEFTAELHARIATAYMMMGSLDEAKPLLEQAHIKEPANHDYLANYASCCYRLGELETALKLYEKCIEINPNDINAKTARDKIIAGTQDADKLAEDLKKEFEANPDKVELIFEIFRFLNYKGDAEDAGKWLINQLKPVEELIEMLDGESSEENNKTLALQRQLRLNLAQHYNSINQYKNSLAAYNQLLKIWPETNEIVLTGYLETLQKFGDNKNADRLLEEYKSANRLSEDIYRFAKAKLLNERNQESAALELLEQINNPNDAITQLKAELLLLLGKIDESNKLLLEISENNPLVFARLINSKNFIPDDLVFAKLQNMVKSLFDDELRSNICFALAEGYSKRKDNEKSFEYLDMANKFVAANLDYKPEYFSKKIQLIINFFTKQRLDKLPKLKPEQPRPIFIVGMPRSGTTLTETIIASHSQVEPCGERSTMPMIMHAMNKNYKAIKPYPLGLQEINAQQLQRMAQAYCQQDISDVARSAAMITDKLPHNFANIGFIHLLFPDSPIIHVRRDPRDNGLSNYQQNFGARRGGMGFAFNLEHLANEINQYHKIMQHWRDIEIPMFEFWYEDLIADQKNMSKKLLDYCGLPWEDNVLEFHKLERSVKTASVSQVRQKMYKSSSQKWRQFEKGLEPMINAFDKDLVVYYEPNE